MNGKRCGGRGGLYQKERDEMKRFGNDAKRQKDMSRIS
jgi:hypothetical protein